MTDDLKLETVDDVMVALVRLAKETRTLAASMRGVLNATAIADREMHAFAHRIYVVVTDMGAALANTEAMLPPKYRDVR
jgi:hypothetical protein